jgi:hypothetical protein
MKPLNQARFMSTRASQHRRRGGLIRPTGKSCMRVMHNLPVVPMCRRRAALFKTPNQHHPSACPAPTRGAYRDRHGRWVRDAMDALATQDERHFRLFVGAQQDRDREAQPKSLSNLEVDDCLECCRMLDWKDRGARTLQNLAVVPVCISRATFSADPFAQCERADFSHILDIRTSRIFGIA